MPPWWRAFARPMRSSWGNEQDEFAMGSSNENSAYGNVKIRGSQRTPGGRRAESAAAVRRGS